jgi:hypothetical protein
MPNALPIISAVLIYINKLFAAAFVGNTSTYHSINVLVMRDAFGYFKCWITIKIGW